MACRLGRSRCAAALVAAGADPTARTAMGRTALGLAAAGGFAELSADLIEHCGSSLFRWEDAGGSTSLEVAARMTEPESVVALLSLEERLRESAEARLKEREKQHRREAKAAEQRRAQAAAERRAERKRAAEARLEAEDRAYLARCRAARKAEAQEQKLVLSEIAKVRAAAARREKEASRQRFKAANARLSPPGVSPVRVAVVLRALWSPATGVAARNALREGGEGCDVASDAKRPEMAFGPEGAEFVSIIESATEKGERARAPDCASAAKVSEVPRWPDCCASKWRVRMHPNRSARARWLERAREGGELRDANRHALPIAAWVAAVTGDKAKTDELLSGVVKMLTKVGLLWKEGKLDQKAVEHLREPGQAIAEEAGLLLRQVGAHLPADDGSSSLPGSAAWRKLALPVLEGLIRDRNIARGHTLGQFYTGTTFVTALLCRADLRPERERLVPLVDEALRRSGKAALVDRPKCVMVGCDLPRATVPGTDFCLAHHAIRFSSPTTLQEFLDSPVYRGCLADYLETDRPHLAPLLAFLERCDSITSAGTRAVLHERTKAIVRRYVAPDAEDRLFFLDCSQHMPAEAAAAASSAASAAAAGSSAAGDGASSPLAAMGPGTELEGQAEPLPWGRAGFDSTVADAVRPVPEPRPVALADARFAAVGGRVSALDASRVQRAAENLCRLAETPSAPIRGDTFVGLTSTALAILDAEFVGAFPHSKQFRAWAEDNLGLPLPRISFARLRMLLERGVSVESITGSHVRQAGPGVVVAVTEIGTSAVGAGLGVPVSLETGEPLEGSEREAALAIVAHLLPKAAAAAAAAAGAGISAEAQPESEPGHRPETEAAGCDSGVRGAAERLGKLGSAGGLGSGPSDWSPETPVAAAGNGLPDEEPAPAEHVVSFVV
ncbi:unnamed protein product [Symbiodinium sp. KB8]|nr:unnamed protein product [Symbiodinium sp. KB8]